MGYYLFCRFVTICAVGTFIVFSRWLGKQFKYLWKSGAIQTSIDDKVKDLVYVLASRIFHGLPANALTTENK